jgi:ketosteroid isomerase-like protein
MQWAYAMGRVASLMVCIKSTLSYATMGRGGESMKHEASSLLELAQCYTAAWCSQDAASVAAFYAIDGSLGINGGPPAVGRAAIAQSAQAFMTAFPDMEVIMDELSFEGDIAVYRWTLVGTNTGPGGTGRPLRISGFEEWRMGVDGLIAESKGHFDAAEYRRQLDA